MRLKNRNYRDSRCLCVKEQVIVLIILLIIIAVLAKIEIIIILGISLLTVELVVVYYGVKNKTKENKWERVPEITEEPLSLTETIEKPPSLTETIENQKPNWLFKILLLGDPSSGKEDLNGNHFDFDTKLTIGVDFFTKDIVLNKKIIRLNLWDMDIEEDKRFRCLIPSYFEGASGAIILYDITNSNSLKHVPEWIQIIREHVGDIPIFFIGNNIDLAESRNVSREEGINLVTKYNLNAFSEISTKTGENVEEIFNTLSDIIIKR
ncbi:MAG: Rab family GTPase [Promethearchaeota archaeon]